MSTDTAFLALMLDAPLMSFGQASRFQRRTTGLHPTRSALTGMICAAAGADKGSPAEAEWLERLDPRHVRLAVLAIPREVAGRSGPLPILRLEDFHTTGGGYDRRTQPQCIPRKAGGGPCDNPTVSRRQYLMDARFGVILAGPRATLAAAAAALHDPRWGLWFGRKNCIPAAPVLRGLCGSEAEAMAALGLAGRDTAAFTTIADATSFAEGTDTLMDVPVSFASRQFRPRRVDLRPAAGARE